MHRDLKKGSKKNVVGVIFKRKMCTNRMRLAQKYYIYHFQALIRKPEPLESHFKNMAPLEAFNPPLGPTLSQCHAEQVTLHMKEKAFSLSGDDFTVKTTSGLEVCKCKGKMLSISDKKGRPTYPQYLLMSRNLRGTRY